MIKVSVCRNGHPIMICPESCAASADTHPKDGDVKQAPLVSGAVGSEASETPTPGRTIDQDGGEALAYLRGQREYFINAIIEDGELLRDVKEWLQECHDWLMTTDLDMQCPMETDPLDLIDRIDKRHSFAPPAQPENDQCQD